MWQGSGTLVGQGSGTLGWHGSLVLGAHGSWGGGWQGCFTCCCCGWGGGAQGCFCCWELMLGRRLHLETGETVWFAQGLAGEEATFRNQQPSLQAPDTLR